MRCFVAKCLAVVTGVTIVGLALLFGHLQNRATDTNAVTPDGSGNARTREVAPSRDARSARPEQAEAPAPAPTPVQPEPARVTEGTIADSFALSRTATRQSVR